MSQGKTTMITGTLITNDETLNFKEICRAVKIAPDLMVELIEYQIITPKGDSQSDWAFDHICLKRLKLARNFYHDLEVNLPGIALAIDMLERIDALEAELARLR